MTILTVSRLNHNTPSAIRRAVRVRGTDRISSPTETGRTSETLRNPFNGSVARAPRAPPRRATSGNISRLPRELGRGSSSGSLVREGPESRVTLAHPCRPAGRNLRDDDIVGAQDIHDRQTFDDGFGELEPA